MKEENKKSASDNLLACISILSRSDINRIFIKLCEKHDLVAPAIEMAKSCLADVSVEEIAEKVFRSLNGIQIGELWDNSGKSN